jgi:hypothetical protein
MRPYLKKTLHKNRAVGVAEGEASALSSNPSTAKKKLPELGPGIVAHAHNPSTQEAKE